jgi:RHS repeat-associated protein
MLTDKLFTGQREITGLSIYHYGARFYSPKLGRFLSADTMNSNPDNPQKFNHYSYVINNPLRYTDPTGRKACDDVEDYLQHLEAAFPYSNHKQPARIFP